MSRKPTKAKGAAKKAARKKTGAKAKRKRAAKRKGLAAKVRGYSKEGLAYAKGLRD